MSKITDAFEALEAVLTLPEGDDRLPRPRVNDTRLVEFDASGRLLAIRKSDTRIRAVELGAPRSYELDLEVEILFAVEGEADAARDAQLETAEAVFAERLYSDETFGGAVEFFEMEGDLERDVIRNDAASPIASLRFALVLGLTAPTPFG